MGHSWIMAFIGGTGISIIASFMKKIITTVARRFRKKISLFPTFIILTSLQMLRIWNGISTLEWNGELGSSLDAEINLEVEYKWKKELRAISSDTFHVNTSEHGTCHLKQLVYSSCGLSIKIRCACGGYNIDNWKEAKF